MPEICERAIVFDCQGDSLVGILSEPDSRAERTDIGLLIVVGGPQYRAGSHRQFVHLSRRFATAGHTSMRFDVRGMGDSDGQQRSFSALSEDINAAVTALVEKAPRVRRVVLMGLCDGASAALMYVHRYPDPRVSGLCLLNPWARSEAGLARTHLKHYYLQRLMQKDFWLKFIGGRVKLSRLLELGQSIRAGLGSNEASKARSEALPFQQVMAEGWKSFGGPIMLGISELDLTAKEFLEYTRSHGAWKGLLEKPEITRVDLAGADHTLSSLKTKDAFADAILDWASSKLHGQRLGAQR